MILKLINKFLQKQVSGPWRKGDRVQAWGTFGKVRDVSPCGRFIDVHFPDAEVKGTVRFFSNGKYFGWERKPSLKRLG